MKSYEVVLVNESIGMENLIRKQLLEVHLFTAEEVAAVKIYEGHGPEGYGWYVHHQAGGSWCIGTDAWDIIAGTTCDENQRRWDERQA